MVDYISIAEACIAARGRKTLTRYLQQYTTTQNTIHTTNFILNISAKVSSSIHLICGELVLDRPTYPRRLRHDLKFLLFLNNFNMRTMRLCTRQRPQRNYPSASRLLLFVLLLTSVASVITAQQSAASRSLNIESSDDSDAYYDEGGTQPRCWTADAV
jgi:hypothetical protein